MSVHQLAGEIQKAGGAAAPARVASVLTHGAPGTADWGAATGAAASEVGPQGTVWFPQNATGDASYVFAALPDLSGAVYGADPGVTISVPSVNGQSLAAWRLATPLTVIVRDRDNRITLPANVGQPAHLASLALGDPTRTVGAPRLGPVDMTTLERVRRATTSAARAAGIATLSARQALWPQNSFGAAASTLEGVVVPAVSGLYLSAALEGPASGRAGVLIEQADGGFWYVSTGTGQVFVGAQGADGTWTETPGAALPSAAYDSAGGALAEYQVRIVSPREWEVSVNGWRAARHTTTSDLTSAGFAFYHSGNLNGAQAVTDLVQGTAARAHVADEVPIVVYGDSLWHAEGLNLGPAELLPLALQTQLGIGRAPVTNRAVSGENSAQQRARMEANGAVGARVCIIAVGTNNIQQLGDLAAYEADLRAMVARAQADGARVVLEVPGIWQSRANTGAGFATGNYDRGGRYRATLRRVAADLGCWVADTPAALGPMTVPSSLYLLRDNLHHALPGVLARVREVAQAVVAALTSEAAPAQAAGPAPTAPTAFRGALLTTTQGSVATGADYPVWTDASYDEGGWWSAGSRTRLVVPAGVSRVRLSGYIRFSGAAGGMRSVGVFKNGRHNTGGVRVAGLSDVTMPSNGASAPTGVALTSGVIAVQPGDWFELFTYQDSGGAVGLDPLQPSYFSIEAVG